MVKVKMRKMEAIFLLVMISIAMSKSSVIACGSPYCRPPVYKPPTVPSPNVPYNPPGGGKCPIDALKLGACVDLLNHLVHIAFCSVWLDTSSWLHLPTSYLTGGDISSDLSSTRHF
ncbi:hypothetical protein SUGI_0491980 [Cryptomeria japonica]|nr:hypothetical protein SUGI_0491980 [Cryptomeria japonica]